MAITYIEGAALGDTGTEAHVRFLVNSGATYTLLPLPVWQSMRLEELGLVFNPFNRTLHPMRSMLA